MERLCVVKTKDSAAKKFLGIFLIVLAVVFALASFLFGKIVMLIPTVALVIVYAVEFNHAEITYDYTFFGTEMKIARIKGDNRRKLLHTINLDDARMITRADDPVLYNVEKEPGAIRKDYTSHSGEGIIYKLVFAEQDKTYILDIEPSEDFLDALCEKYSRIITR